MAKNRIKKAVDLLDVLKFRTFLNRYTDINPSAGIYHRFNKNTNKLREEEKEALKTAIIEFSEDIKKVLEKI